MKFTTVLLALASLVLAAPADDISLLKRAAPTETEIMQFALTLEHIEDTYYRKFLAQFTESDFEKAGFASFVRGRMLQISEHESNHVAFLTKALGKNAPAACTYKFPITDVKSFVALSGILEGVGTTAYLGAAQFLTTPAVITASGSILTTEARQSAWLTSVTEHSYPWNGPMDTPQSMNMAFSLAAGFIVTCPSSNPKLIVSAFPALTATVSGSSVDLTFKGSKASGQFLALLHGLTTSFVPIVNGKAALPKGLQGTVYVVVSSSGTAVSDAAIIAGPAILTFPFSASASNPGLP